MQPRFLMHALILLTAEAAAGTIAAAEPRPLPAAHAHNDYEHTRPLEDALAHGFCSVEADVFLVDGELLVGHDRSELRAGRTLISLYLEPLHQRVQKSGGSVYGGAREFTLLVDIKSDAESTYRALHAVLATYADILTVVDNAGSKPGAVTVIVSGNRAWDAIAADIPRYCGIDGRLSDLDSTAPAHLLPLLSDRWGAHFQWRGVGPMPEQEKAKLAMFVARAHEKGRRLRFWATPDDAKFWPVLVEAGVDLIGVDDLPALQSYLLDNNLARAGLQLEHVASRPLASVRIDGRETRLHTQGLLLTEHHAYATGRLEEKPPQPVLVRFDLRDPNAVETITLSPREGSQDHPGGFDSDGAFLWIPIAESRPGGRTTIVRFPLKPEELLAASEGTLAFHVDDHIGALAVDRTSGRVYGANWDTRVIYVWARDGSLVERIPRERLLAGQPGWAVAVQDWKSLGSGRILLGGVDKSAVRPADQPAAVVEVLNLPQGLSEAVVRLPAVPGHAGTPTREGLALYGDRLWLLPQDLNAGAALHEFRAVGLSGDGD